MKLDIADKGMTLTTEHPASSHGIPVLVDQGGTAYGTADIVPAHVAGVEQPARVLVHNWALWARDMLTPTEAEFASKFA